MDWQPISTAPKDGTRVFCYCSRTRSQKRGMICGAGMASHLLDVTTATYPRAIRGPSGHGGRRMDGWLMPLPAPNR